MDAIFSGYNLSYIFALIIFGVSICILTSSPSRGKKSQKTLLNMILIFIIGFMFRTCLLYFNLEFDILEEKFAGNFAVLLFNRFFEGKDVSSPFPIAQMLNFFPQTLLNLPGFLMFGADQVNLNLTNCFIGSICGIFVFQIFRAILPLKYCYRILLLLSIYPAAINFSFFGLRDMSIYLLQSLYIAGLTRLLFLPKKARKEKIIFGYFIIMLISVCSLLQMRVELLIVVSCFPTSYYLFKFYRKMFTEVKIKGVVNSKKILSLFLAILIALSVLGAGIAAIYSVTVAQIGVTNLVSPLEVIEQEGQKRYDRQFSDSGGGAGETASAIVPPEIYKHTNALTRIPVQVLGMLVLPYPWLLTNISRMLAMIDSILLIYCLWLVWKTNKIRARLTLTQQGYVFALTLSFLIGIFVFGLLINNAGNAFRIRMSFAPYIFIASVFAQYYIETLSSPRKTKRQVEAI
jgi:hypothetical protein